MQSGIAASKDLHTAFQSLVANPSDRGLIVTISSSPESLVPEKPIPSTSANFLTDLSNLEPLLASNKAAYIILRHQETNSSAGGGSFHVVTYVPDAAPVRQKTLFASTRLTLVRELGPEHFESTLFATSKDELTAEGWKRHEAHGSLSAPLTAEEQNLQDIKEAEARESTGTGARKSHVSSGVKLPFNDDVVTALKRLGSGEEVLVQLHIDVSKEAITLGSAQSSTSITPASLSQHISSSEPQYSFYRSVNPSSSDVSILFIYSCPSGSKIKERMLYASSRASVMALAKDEASLEITKKIEISEPSELTESTVVEELVTEQPKDTASAGTEGRGFSRPKRPGKR